MDFPETMALYRTIMKVPFRCSSSPPKIGLIAKQNEGFALKIKLDCALEKALPLLLCQRILENIQLAIHRRRKQLDNFFLRESALCK